MMAEGRRRIGANDLYRFRQVNDPQVSPDGRRVVYTVTQADEKENRYQAALWIVDLASGENRKVTSGVNRDGQPCWSPDGGVIAFTSDRNSDEKGKGQVWTMPTDGGEPTRLTSLAEAAEELAWSPDGGRVGVTASVAHK
jgi:Tol biopolymer transport system component